LEKFSGEKVAQKVSSGVPPSVLMVLLKICFEKFHKNEIFFENYFEVFLMVRKQKLILGAFFFNCYVNSSK